MHQDLVVSGLPAQEESWETRGGASGGVFAVRCACRCVGSSVVARRGRLCFESALPNDTFGSGGGSSTEVLVYQGLGGPSP